ncbi:MAG: hypothetical protein KJ674_01365 [Nanoarchaeota archaeon]|nr:hypothetical protein [Nanoarchaeota archaeon]
MKYLFITSGIALGHCTRDEAIINKLLEKDNEVVIACYSVSYNYFKDKFNVFRLSDVNFSCDGFKFNLIKNLIYNWNILFKWFINLVKLKLYIMKFKPDIIVSDWEPIGLFFKKCVFMFNYDPEKVKNLDLNFSLKFQRYFLNLQYNLAKLFKKTTIVPSLEQMDRKYVKYVDLIVRKESSELDSKENLMKKLNLKREPILVMLGGSKFGIELAKKIVNIADNFDEEFIIFGYDVNKKNVKGFKFKDNFLEYLKVCKGVITLAGFSTLSEVFFYKKPCLAFPIDNHLEQKSVLEDFKYFIMNKKISCSEEHLVYHIKNFLKNSDKLRMKMKDFKLKNGVEGVVRILDEEIQRFSGK